MVRFERSARVARGKDQAARQWAQEVTDYANSNHPDGKLHIFSGRFGNLGLLSWQADFNNLAALDRYQKSFDTDAGYWALIDRGTEFFIENSLNDTIYETL